MTIDALDLATRLSAETGLDFDGSGGRIPAGGRVYRLSPAHHPAARTFALKVNIGWRNVETSFEAGSFAGDLLAAMGSADSDARSRFLSVLGCSHDEGADVFLQINGTDRAFDDPAIWAENWRRMALSLQKGMLPLNGGDEHADAALICSWVSRVAAAIIALLPLESGDATEPPQPAETVLGLPEGARVTVQVNRYERDRRNRAAALAIHGLACKACGVDMGRRYGNAAAGFIEVHHITPVSQLGPEYVIDPRTDLVPLCPNCHAVAHRRSPPYTITELRALLHEG